MLLLARNTRSAAITITYTYTKYNTITVALLNNIQINGVYTYSNMVLI